MAFHSEIKVNYQVLQNIVSDLKKYEKALQSMQTSIANMDRIISENEGKTFVALGKIEHDFDDEIVKCKEEIRDIYTSISNYVSDMSGIIGASPAGSTVLVDRADIYCNKTSIKNACADIGRIGQNLYGHMVYSSAYEDRPNKFAEMQRDARRTSRMREAIQSSARKIDGYYQAIDNIYKNKIKKYENKDDDHEAKIIVIHNKYTGLKDRLRETVKVRWDFWKGVLNWGKDLIVGFADLFILARSLEVYFVYKIVRQDPPAWSKQRVEGLKELKNLTPWNIVESLCQSGSDTLAEKGYVYGLGYIAPDVVITVVTVGSVKAATSADDIARIGKVADRIDDVGDAIRTADRVDDISDAARGVNKIDDLSDVGRGATLTEKQIEEYLEIATQYGDRKRIMLGESGVYDAFGDEYKIFKMEQADWNNLKKATNNNYDEIWKLNKEFIDESIKKGDDIFLSGNPTKDYLFNDGAKRFYQREIDYLTELGYKFEDVGNGTWRAVK